MIHAELLRDDFDFTAISARGDRRSVECVRRSDDVAPGTVLALHAEFLDRRNVMPMVSFGTACARCRMSILCFRGEPSNDNRGLPF
jgi:hypothetical protein